FPRITMIVDEAVHHTHRQWFSPPHAIFQPARELRGMSEARAFSQEAADFEIRANSRFDSAEELEDEIVPIGDSRVALLDLEQMRLTGRARMGPERVEGTRDGADRFAPQTA